MNYEKLLKILKYQVLYTIKKKCSKVRITLLHSYDKRKKYLTITGGSLWKIIYL